MWGPESAKAFQPEIDLVQGFGGEGVEAAGALGPHSGEPAVAQHLQVLRHGWLCDPELCLDDGAHLAGGAFPIGKEFQYTSPDWVAKHVESVHWGV